MKETKPLKVPVSGSEAVWIVPLTATPLTRRFDDKCTQKIYWPPDTKAVTYSTEVNFDILQLSCLCGCSLF